MCGRATGWRGELRLAKLSLAVSDSFLLKRRNRGRRKQDDGSTRGNEEGTEDAEGPTVSFREKKREKESCLSSVPSPVLGSFGPSRKPQISSFSSSCTQPALDLIAYPVFLLIPDFPALLGPSSLLILRLCFSFLFLLSSSLRSSPREVGSKWKRTRRTRIEDRPNEDNSCIDCRGAWNGTSSAWSTSNPAGRLAD